MRIQSQQVLTADCWTPKGFDVGNNETRAFIVTDVGRHRGIVHAIGQITAEQNIDSPADHLLDGKGAVEDAHVGMNTHDHDVLYPVQPHVAVYLSAVIAYPVSIFVDRDVGMLSRPEVLVRRSRVVFRIASAIRCIQGEGRIVVGFLRRSWYGWGIHNPAASRIPGVETHGIGRRVYDVSTPCTDRF